VTAAEIVIDNDVILNGEGKLTIDGNAAHRVFSVAAGVTAEHRAPLRERQSGLTLQSSPAVGDLSRCLVSAAIRIDAHS
jgi:hypothetical protein